MAMKEHFPLAIALLTVAVNCAVLVVFIPRVRQIMARQADPTIWLSVSSPHRAPSDANTLRLKLATDGVAFNDETQLSDARLARIIAENPGKRVLIETAPGVKYEHLKALSHRLENVGVESVALKVNDR